MKNSWVSGVHAVTALSPNVYGLRMFDGIAMQHKETLGNDLFWVDFCQVC